MEKLNLPTSWDQISYHQYLELKELDDSDLTFFSKYIEILAILTNTTSDDDIWEDIDVEEITSIIKGLKWLRIEPTGFKTQIYKYTYKDINKLTLGEFIDLEYFFGEDYLTNLPKICAIIYRQTKQDDWGNVVYEPYDNINLDERSLVFESQSINSIYGIIKIYLDFKEIFYSTYVNLFEPQIDESEFDEVVDEPTPEEAVEIAKEEKLHKWSWENILSNLSGNDLTKYDAITAMPVIFIFNQLSFRKDLNL